MSEQREAPILFRLVVRRDGLVLYDGKDPKEGASGLAAALREIANAIESGALVLTRSDELS